MSDILELTPGSNADIANLLLQKFEDAVNNKSLSGMLIQEGELSALLMYINDLEAEILNLRETYE